MYEVSFAATGTQWNITSSSEFDADAVRKQISKFEAIYSRFRADSLITEMSQHAGAYTLPSDAKPLFDLYRELYLLTDGAFTPLIGDTLAAAGYDASYSFAPGEVSAPLSWDDAIEYDYPSLKVKKPVLLDVGAAGKGYLVDLVAHTILKQDIASFCVDAGGDTYVYGETQRIGLENPYNTSEAIGIARIKDAGLCGSSGNRRKWADWHHIIDPRTVSSPLDIAAVWVTARDTMLADALSTCLFLVPPEDLIYHYDFGYLILFKDLSIKTSKNFELELFI